MFGFLKREKPSAGEILADIAKPTCEADGVFMGACVEYGLRGLGQNGRFQGAYADLKMFKCQTMPDGIEVAGCAEQHTSAILAENVMTLSTVGATPLHWSHLAVGVYCKHAFGVEPEWETNEAVLKASLAVTPSLEIEFTAQPCDHVDPMWTGEKRQGASLLMQVRNIPPEGGTH